MKIVDLFCGAGGVTSGIQETGFAEVIACINHDTLAIKSHHANHPNCQHYIEDIRLFDEKKLPKCDAIWMSADCTHFSIAKGGASRDPDSRSLSNVIFRYVFHCNPNYVIVENVKEFMTWGPLVQKKNRKGELVFKKNGEPHLVPDVDGDKLGSDYRQWVKTLKSMGYENYRWKLLNAADFGGDTSRVRYFGIFAKKGFPIDFPSATHHKDGLAGLEKWKAVRSKIDFSDIGRSIFNRKKPLVEKSMKRILAGLEKHKDTYVLKYMSNNAQTGVNRGSSLDNPCPTITTQGRLGLIKPLFVDMAYTGQKGRSFEQPATTITTTDHHNLITGLFIDPYYGNSTPMSLDKPLGTITTKDTFSLIQTQTKSVPSDMSKVQIKAGDGYYTRKLKEFCQENGICDIFQRMFRVDELLQIQGFPKDYVLFGSQAKRKKFIGNSVVPLMAKKIIEALFWANDKKIKLVA